ncbi:MAG: imidazole glycerol phosphate synthase subunit HisH [Pseudomonadales bacterium]
MSKRVDVAVIDYGMGNLHSVAKALARVAPGARVEVSDDAATIRTARRVVYPGVGAIRDCIGELQRRGLDALVLEAAQSKPLLAICVGMQGLMRHSRENGGVDCLGYFDDEVRFFGDAFAGAADCVHLKVPHMGWNQVRQLSAHPLWHGIADGARFYFVHSYYVDATQCAECVGATEYGVAVAAAVARDNVFAVQFHPEKSHRDGLRLLENFMRWDGTD